MVGRWLTTRFRAARGVAPRAGGPATPVELRVYLPLLWPDGPDGEVDQTALRALGRDYARAGRVMDELLEDLDILCSVVGVGASSSIIEASTVAWSDSFLDAVASGSTGGHPTGTTDATDATADAAEETTVDEVARRLTAFRTGPWGDLAPSGRLLLITWSSASATGDLVEDLGRVADEVRRIFPRAVVAEQSRHRRVVAAIADGAEMDAHVTTLRARCAELVLGAPPTVTVVDAAEDDDVAHHLFRSAQ